MDQNAIFYEPYASINGRPSARDICRGHRALGGGVKVHSLLALKKVRRGGSTNETHYPTVLY
jgi:hypothetical protein